jgi:arylsulfatase A-like enzyme
MRDVEVGLIRRTTARGFVRHRPQSSDDGMSAGSVNLMKIQGIRFVPGCMRTFTLLLAFAVQSLLAAEGPRPNIVFFLIDDLGYADCGFNGGAEIKTPHIDKLAAAGAVLEHHYVQPVCSPTRAALLTGRYATRTGVYTIVRPHAKWGLPLQERTLANALADAGYTTAITGKWHLGEFDKAYQPTARGFHHQHGLFFGMIDNFTHMRDSTHDWHHDDQELKEQGYSTQLITREAIRLIEAQPKDKPLFLYMPYNAVHSPLQVPEEYLAPYAALKGARRQLAGMLSCLDEAIGQVVAALEKQGMRDNTLIVFSSDNGGPPPGVNTPLNGFKGSLWEGGVRAAAFANWPGKIPGGQRITAPMHVIDWYPTLVNLAGGTLAQKLPIDGKDVWPMLTENAPTPHDAILSVQSPQNAALRMGEWKLTVNGGSEADGPSPKKAAKAKKKASASAPRPIALYNLAADPGETTNLAAKEPQRVATMRARLAEMLKGAVPSGASD